MHIVFMCIAGMQLHLFHLLVVSLCYAFTYIYMYIYMYIYIYTHTYVHVCFQLILWHVSNAYIFIYIIYTYSGTSLILTMPDTIGPDFLNSEVSSFQGLLSTQMW